MNKKIFVGYFKTQWGTTKHKFWVAFYMWRSIRKLIVRALVHDFSKYRWVEAKGFAETIDELAQTEYGTEEYRELLKKIKPSIDAHYEVNTHHPEYYLRGFNEMSTLDRVEMCADWLATVRRTKDGSIDKSLEINQKRFEFSDDDKQWMKSIINDIRD